MFSGWLACHSPALEFLARAAAAMNLVALYVEFGNIRLTPCCVLLARPPLRAELVSTFPYAASALVRLSIVEFACGIETGFWI